MLKRDYLNRALLALSLSLAFLQRVPLIKSISCFRVISASIVFFNFNVHISTLSINEFKLFMLKFEFVYENRVKNTNFRFVSSSQPAFALLSAWRRASGR